jgi:hypothetical protein
LVLIAALQAPLLVEHGRDHSHFLCRREALEVVTVARIGVVSKADDSNERLSFRPHLRSLRAARDRAIPGSRKKKKTSPKRGLKM